MKFHITLFLSLLSLMSVCQGDSSDFLDMYLDVTEKRKAVYERNLTPLDEGVFSAEIISLEGKTKAKGIYVLEDGELIPHGYFVFFHDNGNRESEGKYKMGYKVDLWKRYEYTGREKAPKFYQTDFDNMLELNSK